MTRTVRWLLSLEAAAFCAAALVHRGVLLNGYEHWKAATAESTIALVLLAGVAATIVAPGASRGAGLVVQGFALLGTLVGLFTIAVGIGPRTAPDLVFHAGVIVVLACGLFVTARGGTRALLHEGGAR